jgi:hypothetical protein
MLKPRIDYRLPNTIKGNALGIGVVAKCEILRTNGKKNEDEEEVNSVSRELFQQE